MKYLEGSKFTVHVGSSAYSEGWDRIFKSRREPTQQGANAPGLVARTPDGCFDCEYAHAAQIRCSCICHALDDRSNVSVG